MITVSFSLEKEYSDGNLKTYVTQVILTTGTISNI